MIPACSVFGVAMVWESTGSQSSKDRSPEPYIELMQSLRVRQNWA